MRLRPLPLHEWPPGLVVLLGLILGPVYAIALWMLIRWLVHHGILI